MPEAEFTLLPIPEKARLLYTEGQFIIAIRYYGYKINLYLWRGVYFEVFITIRKTGLKRSKKWTSDIKD